MSDPRSPHGVSAWSRLGNITNMDAAVGQLKIQTVSGHLPRNINTRLPSELICEIFLCLARQYWDTRGAQVCKWGVHGWIVVTHVCRYWRRLARGFAELWTRIDASYEPMDLVMELFFLSRRRPLSIRWSESDSEDEDDSEDGSEDGSEDDWDSLDVVLTEMHRTWSFCGRMGASDQLLRVQEALSNAPLLEVLHLSHSPEFELDELGGPVGPFSTPMLRELHLQKPTTAMLRAFVCPLLTHLRVSDFDAPLEVLREFPLLETLNITWSHEFSFDRRLRANPIPLSRLQSLTLGQTIVWGNFPNFFSWVTLPSTVQVIILANPNSYDIRAYTPFYEALASIPSTRYPVRCYMEKHSKRSSEVVLRYEDASVDRPIAYPPVEDEDGQLHIKWDRDDDNELAVSKAALAFLYHRFSSNLYALTIRNFESDIWAFTAPRHLRKLEIKSNDLFPAFRLFSVVVPGFLPYRTPLFPNLETVTLHTGSVDNSSIDRLRSLLRTRRDKDYPLKVLLFVDHSRKYVTSS